MKFLADCELVVFPRFPSVQGLIPDPEEELDLIAMNRPLLDAVPLSDDFDNITDPDQTPGMVLFY